MPEDVVQPGQDAPGPESVKKDLIGVGRLIRVEFIKQAITRMSRIDEIQHFATKHFDLFIVQQTNARDVSVLAIELHLFIAQAKLGGVVGSQCRKQISDRLMILRQVFCHKLISTLYRKIVNHHASSRRAEAARTIAPMGNASSSRSNVALCQIGFRTHSLVTPSQNIEPGTRAVM